MIDTCPCGSGKAYLNCCGAYIDGIAVPETPEALMRSRYTAYTLQQVDYIEKTMRGKAAQHFDKQGAYQWSKQAQWLGLEVIDSKTDGQKGRVEFIARFMINDQEQIIHELSEFKCFNGSWYYTDGKHIK